MHIEFDETNLNIQENSKKGADDDIPNIQQTDTGLEIKIEEISKPENQQKFNQQNQKISLLKVELILMQLILNCQ